VTPRAKKISVATAAAAAIAAPAEGLRQYAYRDPGGVLTVCYGSTTNIQVGKKYSLGECLTRLNTDMRNAVLIVDRCHPNIPERALVAFGDAVYNLGPTIACGPSTAHSYLKQGKIIEACNQLPRWNKAKIAGVYVPLPGLTKRREIERKYCLGETI
jgi:lysozyme